MNTLWRVDNTVIKHFQDSGASPLFPNDAQAEADALRLLAPHEIAPSLLAQGQGWVAYQYCPGQPWRDAPGHVAKTLCQLHRITPPQNRFRTGQNGSAQLLAHAKSIASLCKSPLPPPPLAPDVAAGPTCLIHSDAVPGNLITHQGKVTLIDWQCPAIGDPAEDIATFLSPAMQWLYRGSVLTASEVAAFLSGFPPAVSRRYSQLAPLYHWRMAAHCLWKAEHDASDYAQAMQLELAALKRLTQDNPD